MSTNDLLSLHDKVVLFMKARYPSKQMSLERLQEAIEVHKKINEIEALETQMVKPPIEKGIKNEKICRFISNYINHGPVRVQRSKPLTSERSSQCSRTEKKYNVTNKGAFRLKFKQNVKILNPKNCSRLSQSQQRDSCFEKFHNFNYDYTDYMDKC